jgi:hypothetical protein
MKWLKRGMIYTPRNETWWLSKYAMMPTPEYFEDENKIRVYFGVTDSETFGRTTYIDLNADNPSEILHYPDKILIDIGDIGLFDDSGSIPSSIVNFSNKKYLYYVGFQRTTKVPYMLFSGLAITNDNNYFSKYSQSPIIDRSPQNPYSNAAPFVMIEDDLFKMWTWVGKSWTRVNSKLYIKAEIQYATSKDGINWNLIDKNCLSLDPVKEFSIGRPWVIKDNNIYKMWYSVRYINKLYRLGYAESEDGIIWTRKDDLIGIDVSENGWDSEMICYPSVVKIKNKTYLFYNGNNNGESGFGYAELVED